MAHNSDEKIAPDRRGAGQILALIFLMALAVRSLFMLWVFTAESGNPYPTGDATRYVVSAIDMLANGRFSDRGVLSSYQVPGYTAFVAAVFFLFGQSEKAVAAGQVLMSAAIACLVYGIARMIAPAGNVRLTAAAAGLAAALNVGLVTFSPLMMSETLAVFLLVLSVFFGLRSTRTSGSGDLFWSALFLGLATLTRVAYTWYVVPFVLVLLIHRVTWRRVVLFICVYMLVLAPWMVRNRIEFGEFMLSPGLNHHLLFYFVPKARGYNLDESRAYQLETYAALVRAHDGAPNAVLDNYHYRDYLRLAKERLRQAGPLRVVKTWLLGVLRLSGAVYYSEYTHALGVKAMYIGNEFYKTNVVNAIFRAVAAAPNALFRSLLIVELGLVVVQLAALLYILAIDRAHWRRNVFLALSVAYLLAVGGVMGAVRMRVPLEPFFCLGVGFAIGHVVARLRSVGAAPALRPKTG
jgi:4-amino-4-deoxy-L-arabinose transferase-like glycosyltransferase